MTVVKATQENICDVLGVEAKDLKFGHAPKGNGCTIEGFLPRYAIEDLQAVFHCYFKSPHLVVITKGRLGIDNKI